MLPTDHSTLLVAALRPPVGMHLDVAVGTTFTLDLAALLAIPVASSFTADDDAEPADLLETIRRHAERTVLFCQAGAIGIPSQYRRALTFVEQTVVEVRRPEHGIFHPKLWVLRFEGGGRRHHRVLVMTRNLTFDRALDVIVQLDEDPDAPDAVDTVELERLVSALPGLAARPLSEQQEDLVADVVASLSTARLAVPRPFSAARVLAFRPGGRSGQPFLATCDHAFAMSPYLTAGAVRSYLGTAERWSGLVSRPGALDSIASVLGDVDAVLRPKDVVLSAQHDLDTPLDDDGAAESTSLAPSMAGLHAKVFVQDDGARSVSWIGSANLTDAAFSRNVETLVELTGHVREVGVDVVLSPTPRKDNLSWVVEEHVPSDGDDDSESEELEAAELLLVDLASRRVTLSLTGEPDGHWRADLEVEGATDLLDGVELTASLLTQPRDREVVVQGRASWSALAREHVTPFVVLRVGGSASASTLVRADLRGDPPGRREAVLASAITDAASFLRYLAALLGTDVGAVAPGSGRGVEAGGWAGLHGDRILEDLLTTASRHPDRLVTLDQTLRHLEQQRVDVDEIAPAEFREVWRSVHAARSEVLR